LSLSSSFLEKNVTARLPMAPVTELKSKKMEIY